MMHSKAAVYKHQRTPYYQAKFQVWDATHEDWKYVAKSTRSTDHTEAMAIARKFEKFALAAGPGPKGTTRLSREFMVGVLNEILKISGHEPMVDRIPWAEYSEQWLAMKVQKAAEKAKHRPNKKPADTVATYRSHVKAFTAWLADPLLPISAITAKHVHDWYHAMLEGGRHPTTVNNAATTLASIFRRAVDQRLLTANPVDLLDRIDAESHQRDPFTESQLATLLKYLRSLPVLAEWLTCTLVGLATGQRLSDCASIAWTDLRMENGLRIWRCDQGKTGTIVHIPIVSPLAEHLERLEKEGSTSLYLCPSLAGRSSGFQDGKPGLSSEFSDVLIAAGITGRRITAKGKAGRTFNSLTFHSTRHTCNTLLALAGIPQDVRRKITGHSSDDMNDRYTHFDHGTTNAALVKALTAALGGAPPRKTIPSTKKKTILAFSAGG